MNIGSYITSLRPRKVEHSILISIFLYSLGDFLGYNVHEKVGALFSLLGFCLFLKILLFKKKYFPLQGWSLFFYLLLIIDIIIITIYTFLFSKSELFFSESIKEKLYTLSGSSFVLPSIMPLMLLLFRKDHQMDIGYFVRFMTGLAVLYLCLYPFAFFHMLFFQYSTRGYFGQEGSYGDFVTNSSLHISAFMTPFIMYYFRRYITDRQWLYSMLVSIGALLIAIYTARRGRTVTYLMYYGFFYLLYFIKNHSTSKMLLIFRGILVLLLIALVVIYNWDGFFSLIVERGTEDTRSGVELSFFMDMDEQSWIWGRGWFGQYFDWGTGEYRAGLETGYLTLILRGGMIYLSCYMLILLFSAIRGLFCSKNIFVKSFAVMILMSLFELYPFGWPAFDFKFFVIWMGVLICNSKYYLKMDESRVKSIFIKGRSIL